MKIISKFCPAIFKSRLAQIFFIAVLFISSFAADWNKVFSYFGDINKNHCKPVHTGMHYQSISFSACHYYKQTTPFEVLSGFFDVFSFPAYAGADFLIIDLKKNHPLWCAETFECLRVLVFIIFNALFWMVAGYCIEIYYDKNADGNLRNEKIFSIFTP